MTARGTALLLALTAQLIACGDDGTGGGGGDGGGADARAEPASRVEGYIRSDTYSSLELEIDVVPGFEPRTQVEADLVAGLEPLLDKPGGISAVRDGTLTSRGGDHGWTDAELQAYANETFDLEVGDDTTKIHVMFVDGHHDRDTDSGKILGVAWANQHLVMFKQTIEDVCAAPAIPALIRERVCAGAELSIWTHEIGHVIGLVNTGLPMVADHQDDEHGAHDSNDDCVMYWAYEGEAVVDLLTDRITNGGDESVGFDQACLDDIAAVRDAP